ncbi:amino acid adenylation domain-containing protein [Phytohabitans rumicis]|uniref:amino acid adenylation domain-containing protein n=1 Tax=Phytohabitans rumicis TaxID=1076125 RepID=UPI00353109D7
MTTFVHELPEYDVPAVVTPGACLTYRQLGQRVRRLAQVLAARGVGPERVCVVALERGLDPIVAIAAVVRTGAAFLAVDVDLPDRRIAAFARGAHAMVTSPGLAGRFAGLGLPAPVLLDGDIIDGGVECSQAALPDTVAPRSLAYVSHTSGSTGTPNAVHIEHRWLHPYLRFIARDYGLGPDTVALQLAPLGFDAAIRDTFAPLVAGGTLVVLPRATLLRPEELFAALGRYRINTMLSATPSYLSFLAGQPRAAEHLRGLRLVATTGEAVRPFLAAGGRPLIPGRVVNQYGPTEATMTATRFKVPAEPEAADIIGRPIDGVPVRLLDADLNEVPPGADGEICIGGPGVARGYGDAPALTAARFVPDPDGPPGARLYRTGDLARRRPDGTLEFRGRRDRQIKIRGYRVDPGEIEGALLSLPEVTGAAVTTAADRQARPYLVAHLTGDLGAVTDASLRFHLARILPPHMMPRRFDRLDRFPTTRTGKIDRLALAGVHR